MSASNKVEVFRDPVCGMTVDPMSAKEKVEYAGSPYYFCGARCAQRFAETPDQFLKQKTPGLGLVSLGTPMRSSGASPLATSAPASSPEAGGRDPVCGMSVLHSAAPHLEYGGAAY